MPVKCRVEGRDNLSPVLPTSPFVPLRRLASGEQLTQAEILDVLAVTTRLKAQRRAGVADKPLLGRNLALLLDAPPRRGRSALHRAALDLGVRVAEVRFGDPAIFAQDDLRALARMLGRMYDAIDCGAMALPLVRQIEKNAGVPVYDGLDRDQHPARALADAMTLYEHCPRPVPGASIAFRGNAQTPRGCAFLRAARQLGFEVRVDDPGPPASNDATFVVDATHPTRWSFKAPSAALDAGERSRNHRLILQTVLLGTIART